MELVACPYYFGNWIEINNGIMIKAVDDMDSSGNIIDEADMTPEQKKKCVPIPSDQLQDLKGMSRKDRRDWYKKNKKTWQNLQEEKEGGNCER